MGTEQKFSKHLKTILTEMCHAVDVEFELVNFADDHWYQQHKWTEEEQVDFVKWLTNYLYDNNEARRELTEISYKNKKQLKKWAQFFVFNHGWSFEKAE